MKDMINVYFFCTYGSLSQRDVQLKKYSTSVVTEYGDLVPNYLVFVNSTSEKYVGKSINTNYL
jgi:hypothetical protein